MDFDQNKINVGEKKSNTGLRKCIEIIEQLSKTISGSYNFSSLNSFIV